MTNSIGEIPGAEVLFVIGANPTEAHPIIGLKIKEAVRNGAVLIVADPRKIWLTKIAKIHLPIRPGTRPGADQRHGKRDLLGGALERGVR